jgi:hypothetical protein
VGDIEVANYYKNTDPIPPELDCYVHDSTAKGVDVNIKLKPKGCISEHTDCPNGMVYQPEGGHYYRANQLVTGDNALKLKWNGTTISQSSTHHIVNLMKTIVFGRIESIPATTYSFLINECANDESVVSAVTLPGQAIPFVNYVKLSPLTVMNGNITILPKMKWDVGIYITLKSKVDALSADDRRKVMSGANLESRKKQAQNNKKPNQSARTHAGWTKRTKNNAISRSLIMTGVANFTLGDDTRIYTASLLDSEFQTYKNKLSFINKIEKVLDAPAKLFKSGTKGGLKTDDIIINFLYPDLFLNGGGALKLTNTNVPYIERTLSAEFVPLMGLKITIDLMGIFAKYYHVDSFLDAIKEQMKEQEDNYKNGDNAAYLATELKIEIISNIDLTLKLTSDVNKKYKFDFDAATFRLRVRGEANLRAGLRYGVLGGYYQAQADGRFEGSIQADLMLDFDAVTGADGEESVELTYYHQGVFAMVKGELNADIRKAEQTKEGGYGRGSQGEVETHSNSSASTYGMAHKWIIMEPLSKTDSTYKVTLFD